MAYIIAALGNPGDEYKDTRHNTGRIIAETLAKTFSFGEFKDTVKLKALVSKGEIEGEKVEIVMPNNFMNRSGVSLVSLITTIKKAQKLIVIYDDLDLPLGTFKISYNRSSGGHRGLESIIKSIKTQEFIRIRVGISPITSTGKTKKPSGEAAVEKHIIGPFKAAELEVIKKVAKTVTEAVKVLVTESKEVAMTRFN